MSEIPKKTEINADKIRKDILDLHDKKQTLILSLQTDIDAINCNITNEFCQVGEKAYDLYSDGDYSTTTLKEAFERIDGHVEERGAKEKKIGEIAERYDEEIALLEKLVPSAEETADTQSPESPGQAFCANCGTKYSLGEDVFCMSCGSKL